MQEEPLGCRGLLGLARAVASILVVTVLLMEEVGVVKGGMVVVAGHIVVAGVNQAT